MWRGAPLRVQTLFSSLSLLSPVSSPLQTIGFVAGYIQQDFRITFQFWAAGFAAAMLITVPSWPCFRRNSIKWLPPMEQEEAGAAVTAAAEEEQEEQQQQQDAGAGQKEQGQPQDGQQSSSKGGKKHQ